MRWNSRIVCSFYSHHDRYADYPGYHGLHPELTIPNPYPPPAPPSTEVTQPTARSLDGVNAKQKETSASR